MRSHKEAERIPQIVESEHDPRCRGPLVHREPRGGDGGGGGEHHHTGHAVQDGTGVAHAVRNKI